MLGITDIKRHDCLGVGLPQLAVGCDCNLQCCCPCHEKAFRTQIYSLSTILQDGTTYKTIHIEASIQVRCQYCCISVFSLPPPHLVWMLPRFPLPGAQPRAGPLACILVSVILTSLWLALVFFSAKAGKYMPLCGASGHCSRSVFHANHPCTLCSH